MSAKFLLPHKFKTFGVFMFPLGLIGWIAGQRGIFDRFLSSVNFQFPGIQIILILSFFSFLFGLYFIVFSKEKTEDEFISKMRLESFQFAALIQLLFFISSFLYIAIFRKEPAGPDLDGWMVFFLLAIFIFWLSYIFRFNYFLFQNKIKSFKNEK